MAYLTLHLLCCLVGCATFSSAFSSGKEGRWDVGRSVGGPSAVTSNTRISAIVCVCNPIFACVKPWILRRTKPHFAGGNAARRDDAEALDVVRPTAARCCIPLRARVDTVRLAASVTTVRAKNRNEHHSIACLAVVAASRTCSRTRTRFRCHAGYRWVLHTVRAFFWLCGGSGGAALHCQLHAPSRISFLSPSCKRGSFFFAGSVSVELATLQPYQQYLYLHLHSCIFCSAQQSSSHHPNLTLSLPCLALPCVNCGTRHSLALCCVGPKRVSWSRWKKRTLL